MFPDPGGSGAGSFWRAFIQRAELSGNVGATYEFNSGFLPFETVLHADYSWRSEVSYSSAPQGVEDAYGLLNASIELRHPEGRFSFTLFGKNLTDEFHVSAIRNAGFGTVSHALPLDYRRIWGASLNYEF